MHTLKLNVMRENHYDRWIVKVGCKNSLMECSSRQILSGFFEETMTIEIGLLPTSNIQSSNHCSLEYCKNYAQ